LNLKIISWGDLTWADFLQPTEEARKYLAEHYNFNPMDIDDCFSRRQLSKVDVYGEYLFIVFHLPVYDKSTRISTIHQWSAFVGEKYLVTLRPGTITALDDLRRECEFDEEARKAYFNEGSGYLLYQIIDRAVDSYFPVLDKILGLIDDIEDNVFNEEIEAAKDISILRRDIVTQRRVMFPTQALLAELENKLRRFVKMDLTVYYGDLMDHINHICATLDECKEIIEVFEDGLCSQRLSCQPHNSHPGGNGYCGVAHLSYFQSLRHECAVTRRDRKRQPANFCFTIGRYFSDNRSFTISFPPQTSNITRPSLIT
jgi:magnesium transporter